MRATPILAALALAGCSTAPVDPAAISRPLAELMEPCPPLDPVPPCEAKAQCRLEWYTHARVSYANCAEKAAALQRHADLISPAR